MTFNRIVLLELAEHKKTSVSRQFPFGTKDPLTVSVWLTLLILASLRTVKGFSVPSKATGFSTDRFDTSLGCQLLGINSRTPHDFTSSFQKLARRGGEVDIHSHGWGLAYYCDQRKALCALRDPEAAASSPVAKSISERRSQNMIAHIRYATQGKICVDNVHPFSRKLWGQDWVFAHNGDVPMFKGAHKANAWLDDKIREKRVFEPVGDTDSEALFCAILNCINARFYSMPPLPILHDYMNSLCKEIVSFDSQSTILNFLLGYGEQTQFVYSWPGRREGSTTWNGLHYKLTQEGGGGVAMIATKPLVDSEEEECDWIEMKRGECILFENGEARSVPKDSYEAELYALNFFDESSMQFSQLWEAKYATQQSFTAQ